MHIGSALRLLLVAIPLLVFSDCFFPDGRNASELFPCFPDAEASHCCPASDACLTNGLCFSPGLGTVLRRACTDSTWKNKACLDACNTIDRFSRTDAVLTWCGSYGKYCCGDDRAARDCCDGTSNETLSVSVSSGRMLFERPGGEDPDPPEPSPSSTNTSGVPPNTSCPATPSPVSSNLAKTYRDAMIGVAVALGVLLIGAAALAIIARKRAASLRTENTRLDAKKRALAASIQRLNSRLPPEFHEPVSGVANGNANGNVNGHANGHANGTAKGCVVM